MKKVFVIVCLALLAACKMQTAQEVKPEGFQVQLFAKEYHRNIVFDGVATVLKTDSSTFIQAKNSKTLIEMNFSKEDHLDKYYVGKFIDSTGKIYTTTLWFKAENTTNTKIGELKAQDFWFCAMDENGVPVCISGFIGKKIEN